MAKKTKLKQIISNNIWILRYVFKYAPLLAVEQILQIVVMCISTYITINVTRWILDKADSDWQTGSIILFIIGAWPISIITITIFATLSVVKDFEERKRKQELQKEIEQLKTRIEKLESREGR